MKDSIALPIPGDERVLHPGDRVRLGRFSTETWIVGYGWYSFGGNRPQCGWYFTSAANDTRIKSILLPDLDDIYLIQYD